MISDVLINVHANHYLCYFNVHDVFVALIYALHIKVTTRKELYTCQ